MKETVIFSNGLRKLKVKKGDMIYIDDMIIQICCIEKANDQYSVWYKMFDHEQKCWSDRLPLLSRKGTSIINFAAKRIAKVPRLKRVLLRLDSCKDCFTWKI